MTTLQTSLRNHLERAVQDGRDIAEAAAGAALERFAVGEAEPWDNLSERQRDLRRRLRAHGRQLGDVREANGEQELKHLVTEVAYQHWHRMLFARFLAENHLLIHPEMKVPVTLEECDKLAQSEGASDGWELAGRYASRMLPQVFQPDEPALQLAFAPEHQQKLEQRLKSLPDEVFTASDSLGWVYQFWQSKKKNEVNASGVRIGADELPAVTQLFTEPYMVSFLLHNTLGAWWSGRHPDEDLPVELDYLRTLEDGTPAAGTFDGWPKTAAELKVMDPCCGSGHFLVAAFHLLVPMRMLEEGLSAREACDRVIAENIHGLEIDERCTQIAAFALALAAWTYLEAGGYRPLPEMNIACSGLAVGAKKNEWLELAGNDTRLREGMSRLYDLFKDAPTLGSLIDPRRGAKVELLSADFSELQPLMQQALERERAEGDYAGAEIGATAQGIAKAAQMLAMGYHLVCTNVPYLSHVKQSDVLKSFLTRYHTTGKADLATAFVDRCRNLSAREGIYSLVTPQNWLFLDYYIRFRRELLEHQDWRMIARLGPGAFDTITGEVVQAILLVLSNASTRRARIATLDVAQELSLSAKAKGLREKTMFLTTERDQLSHPSSRIVLEELAKLPLLAEYADYHKGVCTGDDARFKRVFWELPEIAQGWVRKRGSTPESMHFGGMQHIFFWENGSGELHRFVCERLGAQRVSSWIRGQDAWGRSGVVVRCMGNLPVSMYTGTPFDTNVAVITPKNSNLLPAIWAFCSSDGYAAEVRKINQKMNVGDSSVIQVPFDVDHWQRVAEEKYPSGLPEPYSDDPTQWLFKGDVTDTTEPLQVAIARLLGYRWPNQEPDALNELADGDGIVCLPPVRGEKPAADRLRELLAAAYGSDWSPANERELLKRGDCEGKSFNDWLRDKFFEQHFKLFGHRPFIWHIWDGARHGFSALLNYHKLDRKRLETLTYGYLGDWITRQEHEQREGKSGADDRLMRARELQKELEKILAGEPPYDIFVRWKPLEEQPIGWAPDMNDGVRLNIYPFMEAKVQGKPILRKLPNIHWKKDRGNNPPGTPWGPERHNRYEDVPDEHKAKDERGNSVPHLTTAVKRAARAAAQRA